MSLLSDLSSCWKDRLPHWQILCDWNVWVLSCRHLEPWSMVWWLWLRTVSISSEWQCFVVNGEHHSVCRNLLCLTMLLLTQTIKQPELTCRSHVKYSLALCRATLSPHRPLALSAGWSNTAQADLKKWSDRNAVITPQCGFFFSPEPFLKSLSEQCH